MKLLSLGTWEGVIRRHTTEGQVPLPSTAVPTGQGDNLGVDENRLSSGTHGLLGWCVQFVPLKCGVQWSGMGCFSLNQRRASCPLFSFSSGGVWPCTNRPASAPSQYSFSSWGQGSTTNRSGFALGEQWKAWWSPLNTFWRISGLWKNWVSNQRTGCVPNTRYQCMPTACNQHCQTWRGCKIKQPPKLSLLVSPKLLFVVRESIAGNLTQSSSSLPSLPALSTSG